jgi:hypothetical protein
MKSYWNETGIQYGSCGNIVVLETNQIILRSATCRAISARFICTYCKVKFFKNFLPILIYFSKSTESMFKEY